MNIRTDSFEAFEGGRSVMMRYTQKVRTRAMLRVLLTVLVLAAVLGFVSTGAADQGTAQAADPSVTIDLVAHDIAFNTSKITVPAGAEVTVHFKNEDAGIPHNFAVYETRAAEHAIFRGKIITGPSSITYHFTAPSAPGTYFFRCDVHPTIMNGTFVVTKD
jgi:plastocyanin